MKFLNMNKHNVITTRKGEENYTKGYFFLLGDKNKQVMHNIKQCCLALSCEMTLGKKMTASFQSHPQRLLILSA